MGYRDAQRLSTGRTFRSRHSRKTMRGLDPLLVVIVCLFGGVQAIQAATFNCSDVPCLISAILSANGNGQANTINLRAGSYILTAPNNTTDGATGLPSISSTLTIAGAGQAVTGISRDAAATSFRLLNVAAGGNLTLRGVTLSNGGGTFDYNSDGGAIANKGTATIVDSTLNDNHTRHGKGAAIFNSGTLKLTNTIISNNNSNGFAFGAGGVHNSGNLTVNGSIFKSNFDFTGAGAIANTGTATITGSTLSSNSAGEGSPGGGVDNRSGTVTISRSSISDNHATDGGGVYNNATMIISNTTFARNTTFFRGGAIEQIGGTLKLTNVTISGNRAVGGFSSTSAGIYVAAGSVSMQNTIAALNSTPTGVISDCEGPAGSLGNNLIGSTAGCTIVLGSGDLVGDPGLAAFADNGAPGNGNFQLLSTSQAIDAGNNAVCETTDQIGNPRNVPCDIGATEFQPPSLTVRIEIQPPSNPAAITIKKQGVVPVAILSTATFDATTVDPASVRFGRTGTEASATSSSIQDVDGNGIPDRVVTFSQTSTGIACGDTVAWLRGRTIDGRTLIQGSDEIIVLGCKK